MLTTIQFSLPLSPLSKLKEYYNLSVGFYRYESCVFRVTEITQIETV